jgi:hypothetical protein
VSECFNATCSHSPLWKPITKTCSCHRFSTEIYVSSQYKIIGRSLSDSNSSTLSFYPDGAWLFLEGFTIHLPFLVAAVPRCVPLCTPLSTLSTGVRRSLSCVVLPRQRPRTPPLMSPSTHHSLSWSQTNTLYSSVTGDLYAREHAIPICCPLAGATGWLHITSHHITWAHTSSVWLKVLSSQSNLIAH